ncbi:MAG: hypothetical protein WC030_03760 [Candidatus Paceibacterota bacterium]
MFNNIIYALFVALAVVGCGDKPQLASEAAFRTQLCDLSTAERFKRCDRSRELGVGCYTDYGPDWRDPGFILTTPSNTYLSCG